MTQNISVLEPLLGFIQKQLERCDPFFRDMESAPIETKGKSMKWIFLFILVIVLVVVLVVVVVAASNSGERGEDQLKKHLVVRKLWPRPKPCSDGRSW